MGTSRPAFQGNWRSLEPTRIDQLATYDSLPVICPWAYLASFQNRRWFRSKITYFPNLTPPVMGLPLEVC